MSRLFRFLILGLSLVISFVASAQPSLILSDEEVLEGEDVEVVFSVKDFSTMHISNLSLSWDTTYLEFKSLENKNHVDLNESSFVRNEVDNGFIGLEWQVTSAPSVTLDDGDDIFKLLFKTKKSGLTNIKLNDFPIVVSLAQDNNSGAHDIRDFTENGFFFGGNINILPSSSDMVSPPPPSVQVEDINFSFTPDNDIACIGDRICYSVAVENFDSIISFIFPIDWDPLILEFDKPENFNLENFDTASVGATQNVGILRIAYEGAGLGNPSGFDTGFSVPDGTSIVDLCFNVVGSSDGKQSVFVGEESQQTFGREIVNVNSESLPISFTPPSPIQTYDCNETVILKTTCNNGPQGGQVCVDIQPVIFQNVGGGFFTLNWDQAALDFASWEPTTDLGDLRIIPDPSTGALDITWGEETGAPGVNLSQNSTPIAKVCFDINSNASVGSLIDLTYSNETIFDIEAMEFNTVIIESCTIEVMEPILPEPILSAASDIQVPEGEEICVDVLVENFTGITAFEFPVLWNKDVLEFQNITSQAFSDISVNTADANDGDISISWGSATTPPETLQGKAVLLSVCFRAIGTEGSSTGIVFSNTGIEQPFSIENISLMSSAMPGEVTITPGNNNPVTFATERMDNLPRNTSVCIPVTVKNFTEIVSADILVKWDSNVLRLDSLANSQLPDANLNTINNIPGQLSVSWFDNGNLQTWSLDDGAVIFDLCYTTIGDIGACTEIEFPTSVEASQGNTELAKITNDPITGENLGIEDEGSELCITTFGIESFELTDPTCDADGSTNVTIAGGQDGYIYTWFLDDVQDFGSSSEFLLPEKSIPSSVDSVCLTVSSIEFNVMETQCRAVTLNDTRIPDVFADVDRRDTLFVGCENSDLIETTLLGNFTDPQEASGGAIEPKWTAINGGTIKPFSDSGFGATAVGLGTYIFTVTNPSGCTGSDTLEIISSAKPTVNLIADNDDINCNNSQVTLSAEPSVEGNEWDFTWTNSNGEVLTGIDPLELVVEQGGVYTFSVMNVSNGCGESKEIFVDENKPNIVANAGNNVEFRCEDDFITLDVRMLNDDAGNLAIEWTSDNPITNPNSLNPIVTEVGAYILEITDTPSGCSKKDTVQVFADTELPVAKVRDEAFIGCNQTRTILRPINDGLDGTSVGAKFEYTWTTADGVPISEEDTAAVSTLGEYLFIVVNSENDACAADTARVQVVRDTTLPELVIPAIQTISCTADCIEIQVETNDIGSDFTYEWRTDVGNFCSDVNSLTAQVDGVGAYFIDVTNTANNCSKTFSTIINPDPENGVFPEAGFADELTCQKDTVLLDGGASSSSTGNELLYEWRFEEEQEVRSTEIVYSATEPGTYRLTVIDEAANCQGSGTVEVTENKDFPEADAGSDFPLEGCVVEAFQLNALNSTSGDGIDYQWTSTDGEIISDETTLTPTVSQPGTYTLVVTNEISGCTATDDAVVSTTVFSPAAIVTETERALDCNENTIILDAENSITEDGTNTATIEWTTQDGNIISGADTKSLVVDSAGTYILILTADNGCEDRATVVVTNTARLPEIDAGEGFRITCNEQMTIDASNSSAYENLVFQWTTNDGSILSGANTLMPEINLGGTYTLAITDTTNNCRVEDMVVIDSDEVLPVAQAGENIEVCGREAALSASPVTEGITGDWTVLNGGQIDANDPLTNVSNLSAGRNQFIWTLSSDDCPNFSSDTVTVNALTLPVAVADDFEYIVGEGTVELDLVGNDQPNTDNFAINIIREPTSSILNKVAEGVYSFDLPSRPIRQDFQYEICSATCADVCADATVRLVVRPEALDSLELTPNAITPNGDGLNDLLIFDELFIEDFPQSELVVFNRWGDVIYKVSPYNNDWQGEGSDGTAIPEGTYYYILRLDISEGEIIRGDVTIMR